MNHFILKQNASISALNVTQTFQKKKMAMIYRKDAVKRPEISKNTENLFLSAATHQRIIMLTECVRIVTMQREEQRWRLLVTITIEPSTLRVSVRIVI